MEIVYKDTHELDKNDLERLFLSVEWSSGHYPEKLAAAMRDFETVYTAWDGDRLVGLICAMDDGVMTAYIHYLLVDPAYHHRGIGARLVGMMKEKYRDYLRIALIAYKDETEFYRSCGFQPAESAVPMFITELWT
ncbi:MAG: GNAT family N-acetyltransferase [Acutalibacteraceae bacterium]